MKNITHIQRSLQLSLLTVGLTISTTCYGGTFSENTINNTKPTQYTPCTLSISKYTKERNFNFGQVGTYIIDVSNSGKEDCYNVIVTDRLPQGMTIDPGSISNGWDCDSDSENPQTVMCYYEENPLLAGNNTEALSFNVAIPTEEEAGGYGWNKPIDKVKNCATVRGKDTYKNVITNCTETIVHSTIKESPFKIKVDTRIDSHNHPYTQFQIPTNYDEYRYNYNVDCDSDGINEAEGVSRNYTCNYITPGIYTISISGTFPQIEFIANCEHTRPDYYRVISLEQWGTIAWKSMRYSFISTKNMLGNALDTPDLSSVEDMSWMFRHSNFNQNISNWDVSNIKNMRGMFMQSAFTEILSNWDVSSVTNMSEMFYDTNFNQNISRWNVSSVTNMVGMFSTSTFNQDIGDWDVSNVTNMSAMFSKNEAFNHDIGDWVVSSVTNMSQLFRNGIFNQDISNWNVSSVTDMRYMFYGARNFSNNDLSLWNIDNVINYVGFSHGWGSNNISPF